MGPQAVLVPYPLTEYSRSGVAPHAGDRVLTRGLLGAAARPRPPASGQPGLHTRWKLWMPLEAGGRPVASLAVHGHQWVEPSEGLCPMFWAGFPLWSDWLSVRSPWSLLDPDGLFDILFPIVIYFCLKRLIFLLEFSREVKKLLACRTNHIREMRVVGLFLGEYLLSHTGLREGASRFLSYGTSCPCPWGHGLGPAMLEAEGGCLQGEEGAELPFCSPPPRAVGRILPGCYVWPGAPPAETSAAGMVLAVAGAGFCVSAMQSPCQKAKNAHHTVLPEGLGCRRVDTSNHSFLGRGDIRACVS